MLIVKTVVRTRRQHFVKGKTIRQDDQGDRPGTPRPIATHMFIRVRASAYPRAFVGAVSTPNSDWVGHERRLPRPSQAETSPCGDERDYFRRTIGLPAGEVYVAPIGLTRGNPETETAGIPALRVSTPVYMPDGRLFGIMSVSIDMHEVLARIRSVRLGGERVFVVNEQGDYLVHPNPAKEFGFEFGEPARLQDDFGEFRQRTIRCRG